MERVSPAQQLSSIICRPPSLLPARQVDDEDLEEEELQEGAAPPAPGSGIKLHGPGGAATPMPGMSQMPSQPRPQQAQAAAAS